MDTKDNSRYNIGQKMMDILDPKATDNLKEMMKEICPEMVDYVVEFAYGDIMAREGLDLRTRELTIIAAICAMGGREKELKIHIKKAAA